MQRLFDLAIFGGVTHAGKAITAGTERIARHHGDMFFTQQFLGEVFIVHARGLDVGKGIESATRFKSCQTEAAESGYGQATAPVIFRPHSLHVRFTLLQRDECRFLCGGGRLK